MKPIDPKMTKVKGYMSDPSNVYFDETVNITKGLSDLDRCNAKIILNQQLLKVLTRI